MVRFVSILVLSASSVWANDPLVNLESCKATVSSHVQGLDIWNTDSEESIESILSRSKIELGSKKAADQVTYVLSERIVRWIRQESEELTELEAIDPSTPEVLLRKNALEEARTTSLALEKRLAPMLTAHVAHWETAEILLERSRHASGELLDATLLKLASAENVLKTGIDQLRRDIAQEKYNETAKDNMSRSLKGAEEKHARLIAEIEKLRSRSLQERMRRSFSRR